MKKYLYLIFGVCLLAGTCWFVFSNGQVPFTEPRLKKAIVWEICNSRNVSNHLVLSSLKGCFDVKPQVLDVSAGKDGRRCVNAKVEVARNRMIPVRLVVFTDPAFSFATVSILGTNREDLFPDEANAQIEYLQTSISDPKKLCQNPNLPNNLIEAKFFLNDTPLEIRRKELEWNYYCGDLSKEEARRIANDIPKRAAPPRFSTSMPGSIGRCDNTQRKAVARSPVQ
jgi:hypothetical protein